MDGGINSKYIFPKKDINSLIYLLINSQIFFLAILIINLLYEELPIKIFSLLYFLITQSLAKYFISARGIVDINSYRIKVNVFYNGAICIISIIHYCALSIDLTENFFINIPFLVIFILQFIEGAYFLRKYRNTFRRLKDYYYKKLGASEFLNSAFKIRQKIIVIKEILLFRLIYFLPIYIVLFDFFSAHQIVIFTLSIIANVIIYYSLNFHINCENTSERKIIILITYFAIFIDILIGALNFIFSKTIGLLIVDDFVIMLMYLILYSLLIYYLHLDLNYFGSGLRDYLVEGGRYIKRGRYRLNE